MTTHTPAEEFDALLSASSVLFVVSKTSQFTAAIGVPSAEPISRPSKDCPLLYPHSTAKP
ncbi:hypothetical protein FOPG_18582 [Fusarium oxysporum f. sp. conglutinans race 2 54008]|uniref:Uncharacterized protein n=1 Tax=Fusarium oxysporum f. sp. conglutinans race 2 54008 TaxID=1089457 RepID=X0GZ72_FUSOX|nr:hypothetical protein FOPG_18582 [Fusarium oxysporum f. sp. conglutinans race 2 54008]